MPAHPQTAGVPQARSSLLDVAAELERRLPLVKGDTVAAAALADDVRRRIFAQLGEKGGEAAGGEDGSAGSRHGCAALGVPTHQAGVRLWNLVLRLARDPKTTAACAGSAHPPAYQRLLLHSRVLAFVAIHSSFCTGGSSSSSSTASGMIAPPETNPTADGAQLMYLLSIAVRTARTCTDEGDVDLGRMVLGLAAAYSRRLKSDLQGRKCTGGNGNSNASSSGEDAERHAAKLGKLEAELAVLQTIQLGKENRLDQAERFFMEESTRILRDTLDAPAAEAFAAALLDIGRGLLAKRDARAAIAWLDRAEEIQSKKGRGCEDAGLAGAENEELRVAITHARAVASLALETPDGYKQATALVQRLHEATGDNDPRMQLAQLELYASPMCTSFDASGYAAVLLHMVKGFADASTDDAFQLLHHHIQKLHAKSPGLGCDTLDAFLLSLRHRDDAMEWIEKLIITRIWLLAHQREGQEGLDKAEQVLSKLRIPISSDTAVAAQTLMWKRIEQGYQERQYDTAARWCRLALCHVFEAGGRANRALIERKLLLCLIENGALDTAKDVYRSMAESTRDEPMTKYILFKLAIQADDPILATDCLRSISTSANGREMLYACVLHARHAKAPRFVVQALRKLADAVNHGSPGPTHTPALFRCIVLMLRDIIDGGGTSFGESLDNKSATVEQETAMRDLADVFEGVVEAIEVSRDCNANGTEKPLFTMDELEWFCRAAYNLGLKYSGAWDLRYTVRILSACIKIIKLFPAGHEMQVATDVTSKTLNCHFLVASALAALARGPAASSSSQTPAEEDKLRDYHAMREHIKAFQTALKQRGGGGKRSVDNFRSKIAVLLIFDFEGAIALGDWDELENICERAVACQNDDTFRVLGDCLLRSQVTVPSKKFVSTMRFLVSKLQGIGKFSRARLVKYYRCLFQAALYRDNDAAFQVLAEVCHLLDDENGAVAAAGAAGAAGGTANTYEEAWPEDELQFLAVTAFNEGIDWFAGGREEQARQWARSAMRLAGRCRDNGQLKRQICERFTLLQLGDLDIKASVEADGPDETASAPAAEMGN